jgi:hypothetical protein
VVGAVWENAGDAMLANATAAMKANFDVLIIVLSLGSGVTAPPPYVSERCAKLK